MALATTKESNNILVEDEAWSYAMVLSSGVALPMVLKAVIELDVLEIIKQAGPGAQLSPTEIAAKLAIQNPEAPIMLDRMLCLLASYSVLTCSTQTLQDGQVERLYGLTLVCKFLTKDEDGLSLGSCSLLWHDKVAMEPWYHIKEAILEAGAQFYRVYGVSHYAYSGKDPRCNKLFNNAMADMSSIVMKKILGNYKGFEGISTLVDMAGNTGASLSMVISKYPTIKGINFDLPHVINEAPSYPGVTNIAGDMFTSVPKGDAIFVKSIFHNWDDEHCLKLMKNCYTALPNHGKVIACEYILPVIPKTNNATRMAYHFDITMMVGLNAKERTEPEFEALGKAAGFEGFRIACSAYDFKVMEFLKTN